MGRVKEGRWALVFSCTDRIGSRSGMVSLGCRPLLASLCRLCIFLGGEWLRQVIGKLSKQHFVFKTWCEDSTEI